MPKPRPAPPTLTLKPGDAAPRLVKSDSAPASLAWSVLARATNRRTLWAAMLTLLRERFTFDYGMVGFPYEDGVPVDLRSDAAPRRMSESFNRRMTNPNPAAAFTEAHPDVRVAEISEALTPKVWEQHPLYVNMFAPQGWYYALGLFFRREGRFFALVAFARGRAAGTFSAADHAVAEEMHPHFAAAIERVWEIECRSNTAGVLARKFRELPQALALFDAGGRLLWCTRAAHAEAARWGAASGGEGAWLLPASAAEALGCLRSVTASETPPPQPVLCRHPQQPGRTLQVSAEPPGAPGGAPLFFVQFLSPGSTALTDASSRWLALLTPAERRVAEAARDGLPNREIASRLHLSVHTVSAHLRQAFAKLDVRSRHALSVRLGPSRRARS